MTRQETLEGSCYSGGCFQVQCKCEVFESYLFFSQGDKGHRKHNNLPDQGRSEAADKGNAISWKAWTKANCSQKQEDAP